MNAGMGGFAQTPDSLNRRQPGRECVSLQTSRTRKEAVLARGAGPSAHKSASGRDLPTGAETQLAELGFPAALSSEAEAGCERPRAGHLPLRAGSERGGTRPPPHPEKRRPAGGAGPRGWG